MKSAQGTAEEQRENVNCARNCTAGFFSTSRDLLIHTAWNASCFIENGRMIYIPQERSYIFSRRHEFGTQQASLPPRSHVKGVSTPSMLFLPAPKQQVVRAIDDHHETPQIVHDPRVSDAPYTTNHCAVMRRDCFLHNLCVGDDPELRKNNFRRGSCSKSYATTVTQFS